LLRDPPPVAALLVLHGPLLRGELNLGLLGLRWRRYDACGRGCRGGRGLNGRGLGGGRCYNGGRGLVADSFGSGMEWWTVLEFGRPTCRPRKARGGREIPPRLLKAGPELGLLWVAPDAPAVPIGIASAR
jgi:hypothetical protein